MPSASASDSPEENAAKVVVAAYRKLASLHGCAPSERTTDSKILEVYIKTVGAFREAARRRGEHLPAGNLNSIVLKFLTVYETLGDSVLDAHLAYEAKKYLNEGLRDEYRRKLDLASILIGPPPASINSPEPACGAPEPLPSTKNERAAHPVPFVIPLPSDRLKVETASTAARSRSRAFWLGGILLATLSLVGVLIVWLHDASPSWHMAVESPEALHARAVAASEPANGPPDYPRAAALFRAAAEMGHAPSQYELGRMYANCHGVQKDDSEAVRWFRLAAEQGHGSAQFSLGVMYQDGRGVPEDASEAVKWYRRAAEQGDAKAQFNLGALCANGEGVSKDDSESAKWYHRAAEQGHASAQFSLALMYANGKGVQSWEIT